MLRYSKARLIFTRVFQIKLLHILKTPPAPTLKSRLFNLIAPTLMHQEPITQGVQPPCLAFSRMKFLSTFSRENGITVP